MTGGAWVSRRLYALLLCLYPPSFRRRYGEELRSAFRGYATEPRHAGPLGRLRLWRFLAADLLRSLPAAYVDAMRARRRPAAVSVPRRGGVLGAIAQDVRYGARGFARTPGFTLACLATLALGIGGTTTIFSVVDTVLLRGLPYADAERLVQVGMRYGTVQVSAASPPDIADVRATARSFAALAGSRLQWLDLVGEGEPERFDAAGVTASYFDVLGVRPALGRAWDAGSDGEGGEAVVVLSHGLWQRRFGGDPAVLGRSLMLNGRAWTVVGVLPRSFHAPAALYQDGVEVWFPLGQVEDDLTARGNAFMQVVGRLAEGATVESASAELAAIARALDEQYPGEDARSFWVASLHERTVGDAGARLYVLLGAVGFLLLIACANVANLFLVRSTERVREIAVRSALGAGRRRIATQLLAESALLGLAGGALGVALAWAGLAAFRTLSPGDVPRLAEVAIDARVLAFAAATALATGLLFGLAPAIGGARSSVVGALRDGGHGSTAGSARSGLRGALVVAQIAIALVLLTGAGLLINGFVRLSRVDAGFAAGDVVWLHVILPERYASDEARLLFFHTLRERLAALPGVVAAGAIHGLPLDGNRSITSVEPEGAAGVPGELPRVPFHSITPDYFRSLGIDLAAGRDFTNADRSDSPPVAIVSEAFAQRHWPGEAAVGRRIRLGPADRPPLTVVGVAGDVRHYGLAQDVEPMLYLPLAQRGRGNVTFALRHDGRDPAALLVAMRAAVWSLDGTLPLDRFGTMAAHVRTSLVQPRFYTALLAGFGGVAVILAFVGLYGTLAYTVRTRSRELGIRVALGAASHDLRRLIVRHGMRLAFAGIALGVAGAFAAARMLGTFVHGVAPTDPATYAAVVGGMVLVALAACWLPARRAARLDPVRTLRGD